MDARTRALEIIEHAQGKAARKRAEQLSDTQLFDLVKNGSRGGAQLGRP